MRWYGSWPWCRHVISGIRSKLHENIVAHLGDRYCEEQRYCVVFYNGKPCGVLKAGMYWEREMVPQKMPFICEAATTQKWSGAGAVLFDAFVKEYGTPFWLKCMDSTARKFWQHMGKKRRLPFRTVGRTAWNTAVICFG